jgi:hypothetical protein
MGMQIDCGPPGPGDNAIPRRPRRRIFDFELFVLLLFVVAVYSMGNACWQTAKFVMTHSQAQAVPASFQPQSYTLLEVTEYDSNTSQATIPGYPTFNDCVDASNELLRQKKAIDSKYSVVRPNMTLYCVPAATR